MRAPSESLGILPDGGIAIGTTAAAQGIPGFRSYITNRNGSDIPFETRLTARAGLWVTNAPLVAWSTPNIGAGVITSGDDLHTITNTTAPDAFTNILDGDIIYQMSDGAIYHVARVINPACISTVEPITSEFYEDDWMHIAPPVLIYDQTPVRVAWMDELGLVINSGLPQSGKITLLDGLDYTNNYDIMIGEFTEPGELMIHGTAQDVPFIVINPKAKIESIHVLEGGYVSMPYGITNTLGRSIPVYSVLDVRSNLLAGGTIDMKASPSPPMASGNDVYLWNSNKVLFVVSATRTNLWIDAR